MDYMFQNAYAFDQPLQHFDTSNVQSFAYMFDSTVKFNRPLPFDTRKAICLDGLAWQVEGLRP